MSQRLDIVIVRGDGSKARLVDQASTLDALWNRLRTAAQSAESIDIRRHVVVLPPSPPPPPPPPVPLATRGARVVYFSDVTDYACERFAQLGPGYTARLSADLNESQPEVVDRETGVKRRGAYYATDEQIKTLRSGGSRIEAWCDGDQTPIRHMVEFANSRRLDGISAQFETIPQWDLLEDAIGMYSLLDGIGNPSALLADPAKLKHAIDLAGRGLRLIGEVMNPDPSYSAQGIPITSACFYIDRDDAQGGYQPLEVFGVMPAGMRASCSVYTGGRMRPSDWDLYQMWTKP